MSPLSSTRGRTNLVGAIHPIVGRFWIFLKLYQHGRVTLFPSFRAWSQSVPYCSYQFWKCPYFISVNMQVLLILALATCGSAWGTSHQLSKPEDCVLKKFTNLVTFGDRWVTVTKPQPGKWLSFYTSYTGESRLGYFISHNGSAPPARALLPKSTSTPGGGITWDRWVST